MDSIIIFCAKYLFVLVVLTTFWVWLKLPKTKKVEFALSVMAAAVIAVILTKIAQWLYFDPRPFVTHHIKPLVAHGADNGFPSEHTVLAMTLTSVVYYYKRTLFRIAFLATLAVGIGRVFAHVHSPVDILAGLVVGAAAGSGGHWLIKKYIPQPKKPSPASD